MSTDLQDKIRGEVRFSGLVSFGTEPDFHYLRPEQEKFVESLTTKIEQLVTEARLGELEWVKSVSAKWGIPSYEIMAKTMEERIKTLQERKSQ